MSLFPIYDSRHPQYYEKRAGYPLPSPDWYRNSDQKGNHVPMTFSKENFVQGFDLTCGEYYILREDLISLLLQYDLVDKDLHKDMNAKFIAWHVWTQMKLHPLLQHPVHPKWHHDMLWKWISSTSQWMRKHEEALDSGVIPDKGWEWGPERLSQKNCARRVQLQHIKMLLQRDRGSTLVAIRVLSLVHGENCEPSSPVDITAEDIHVEQIHNVLARKGILGNWRLAYRDADGEEMALEMDEELWAALSQFQKDGRALPNVDEMVIEMTEVQASTEVGSDNAEVTSIGMDVTERAQEEDEVLVINHTDSIEDAGGAQKEDEVPGINRTDSIEDAGGAQKEDEVVGVTGTKNIEDTRRAQEDDEVVGGIGTKDIEDTRRTQEDDEVSGADVPQVTGQEEVYEDNVVSESQQIGKRSSRPRKSKNKRQKRSA